MRRPQDIARDVVTMSTMVNLTNVFESLASMRIAQVKGLVEQSEKFFAELWFIYRQIRVDTHFRLGHGEKGESASVEKELRIAITGEGGFSGDIDQRLIRLLLEDYDKDKHDIIIIGHHGAVQLAQNGVNFVKYFKLPRKDIDINVEPIAAEVPKYRSAAVYYQSYVSLATQDVKRVNLSSAIQERGIESIDITDSEDVINEDTYIFEPSTYEVVDHLERSMIGIVLAQVILTSKLAQYASRFRAMTAAHERADDSLSEFKLMYNRSKRAIKDERLKEIVNGMRKAKGRS